MTRILLAKRITLALLFWMLTVGSASAFSVSLTSGNVVRWNKKTITYALHPQCSADLPTNVCYQALRDSFAAWEGQACAELQFNELAMSNNLKLTAIGYSTNQINELAFIENNQWQYGSYTLGVTAPVFYQDGTIFEADIAFNGLDHIWTANGEWNKQDVMNVAVHEIGHFFGMQHNLGGYDPNNPPTMATTADPNLKSKTPEPDDLKGVCFLQPKGSYSCASTADCPLVVEDGPQGEFYSGQITCTNGLCGGMTNELPEGDGKMGDACVANFDCEEPLFCQQLNAGAGVCASNCDPNQPNCPEGYECVGYQNSPNLGVCLEKEGNNNNGTKGVGEPCDSSFECESQLCVYQGNGGYCRQQCNNDADCPDGEYCAGLQGAPGGACFEGGENNNNNGDLKGIGEACGNGTECASGVCAGGEGTGYFCVQLCDTTDDCPDGYVCYPLQGGGGACFAVDVKEIGEGCSSNDECASGVCVSLGGAYFCSDNCTAHTDCPCGMKCTATNGGNFCEGGAPKVSCIPDGETCATDSECSSGICLFGVCQIACSIFTGDALCPDGQGCGRLVTDKPDGFCMKAGMKGTGEYCAADLECYSLFCYEGACETPCNPYSPNTCAAGLICDPALGDVGVCSEPAPEPADDGNPPDAGSGPGTPATPTPGTVGGQQDDGGCASTPPGGSQTPMSLFVALLMLVGLSHRRQRR
jgi:MYXO-CTERM domain-containing protein